MTDDDDDVVARRTPGIRPAAYSRRHRELPMTETRRPPAVRELGPAELITTSAPLQMYAFFPSPARPGDGTPMEDLAPYLEGNLTLAVVQDGVSVAEAAAIPLRQNVRGLVCDMAGVTAVATHPRVRRQGHARRLMTELLGQMRDRGCAVSCLYPFRPSFWQRFGYVGLPKARTTSFPPAGLAPLLPLDLPGELTVEPVADGYGAYRAYLHRVLADRHGFAVMPEFRAARLRDINDRWLVTHCTGGTVTGVMLYRVGGFDGDLTVDVLLTDDGLGRAGLLRYLGLHADQVARIVLPLAPDDLPELWATDLQTDTEARITLPGSPAPMARVLWLPGLAGMPVGPGRVAVRVVDDPFLGGDHLLDGTGGTLEVSASTTEPTVVLTAPGLSGLVYGVLDPQDVVARGLGTIPEPAGAGLRSLFPRRVPHLTAAF